MISKYRINAYLKYRKTAVSKHGIHSPFVYDLVTKVFLKKKEKYGEDVAEDYRTECILNKESIDVLDLGSGKSGPRKIASIAKKVTNTPAHGQLLYRIIKYIKPKKMLELGTSLGITTYYEASACKHEKFISLEGCPQTAAKAVSFFEQNKLNVTVRIGDFQNTLLKALQDLEAVDYIFFDGNHQENATVNYFETCIPFITNDTIFIFDDIHWSAEMESAWEKIKMHPKTKMSLDLFHLGIIFFREEQKEREHFVIRY